MQEVQLDMQLHCASGIAKKQLFSLHVVLLLLLSRFFYLLVAIGTPMRKAMLQENPVLYSVVALREYNWGTARLFY